jgi:N-acetyl-beta-hexosaminidase
MWDEELKTEVELHGYFIRRVERILHKLGRKMIGWDEILDGGVSKSATVMSWRGSKGGIKAANQGNQVIMTPWDICYFDYQAFFLYLNVKIPTYSYVIYHKNVVPLHHELLNQ